MIEIMTFDEIISYGLKKKNSYIDYPFGDTPTCVRLRVGNRTPIFVMLNEIRGNSIVTLSCEPMTGDFYRRLYPGKVVRGYHCPPVQQPHFNTVILDGTVPDDALKTMIDEAYEAVVKKLPKKLQQELVELTP